VLDIGDDNHKGMGCSGGKCGTSRCNQWGLCGVIIFSAETNFWTNCNVCYLHFMLAHSLGIALSFLPFLSCYCCYLLHYFTTTTTSSHWI